MRENLRELARGTLRPSLPALVGSIVVALGWTLVSPLVVTPERVARAAGPVLAIGEDRARATGLALDLRFSRERPLTVVLLGASDLREAVVDVDVLAARLSAAAGEPVRVIDLTVDGIRLWEIAELAACVPNGFRGLLVVGVNPTRLAHPPEEIARDLERLLLACDAGVLAGERRAAGLPAAGATGVYAIDHLSFLAARRHDLVRLALGHGPPPRHRWHEPEPPGDDVLLERAAPVRAILAGYEANWEASLGVLGRLAERARRRGEARVVLVETPRNPALDGRIYPLRLVADHRERLRRFAAARGLTYRDVAAGAALRREDFTDHCHLRTADARARYTAPLVRFLAGALEELAR